MAAGLVLRNRLLVPADGRFVANFAGTENPLDSTTWRHGATHGLDWTNLRVLNGRCIGTETGSAASIYDDATAVLTGTWSPNHRATATLWNTRSAGNWNSEVEVRVRTAITAHVNRGYEINFRVKTGDTPYFEIIRWNGAIGDFTALVHQDGSQYGLVTGDTFGADMVGGLITVYQNGTQIWQYNTATGNNGGTGGNPGGADSVIWTDGNPGLGTFVHDFGATSDATLFGFTAYLAEEV